MNASVALPDHARPNPYLCDYSSGPGLLKGRTSSSPTFPAEAREDSDSDILYDVILSEDGGLMACLALVLLCCGGRWWGILVRAIPKSHFLSLAATRPCGRFDTSFSKQDGECGLTSKYLLLCGVEGNTSMIYIDKLMVRALGSLDLKVSEIPNFNGGH